METHRFNDVKIDLDRLDGEELFRLREYVGERLIEANAELAKLDQYMNPNNVIPLFPADGPERAA